MMIWDLNIAVLYGRFLSYRGGLYNRFDCVSMLNITWKYGTRPYSQHYKVELLSNPKRNKTFT